MFAWRACRVIAGHREFRGRCASYWHQDFGSLLNGENAIEYVGAHHKHEWHEYPNTTNTRLFISSNAICVIRLVVGFVIEVMNQHALQPG